MKDEFRFVFETEDKLFPSKITLKSKGKLLILDKPWIMGILNATPDSFYEKSRIADHLDLSMSRAAEMLTDGADILDIGGYSTRPGAEEVSLEEELRRVLPVIEAIKKKFPESLISIDTFRAEVARLGVLAGADFVNDISGGELDEAMLPTVAQLKVPYICMHMRGNPKTMNSLVTYDDPVKEISKYFSRKLNQCKEVGIKDVLIDPGFGFAKTLEQNYWILKNLSYFKYINAPILVGVSRKSMIYTFLGITPEEALNGTTALHMFALLEGANVLRVHDVKQAKETVNLYKQLQG
ncbi:dihydropteroate synthase [Pararhodonellum marinum]|uniref:dihydropteroate synthase n=1 Tax=Pararhodonellum marinum TaxID=2755358 RepID=UPI001E658014|nr:dihydropteroate synthase [Pararhodonellum marinum]